MVSQKKNLYFLELQGWMQKPHKQMLDVQSNICSKEMSKSACAWVIFERNSLSLKLTLIVAVVITGNVS